MTLISGYSDGEFVVNHSLGRMIRVYKKEYDILFEKCVVDGNLSKKEFENLSKLKYNSYIVQYESNDNCHIVIENIKKLPEKMSEKEIGKMIIDMLYAIKTLKEYKTSTIEITIDRIYQTNHHYKLDAYPIGNREYKFLIQDVCQIGLQLFEQNPNEFYKQLLFYVNIKYQDTIENMIRQLESIEVTNESEYLLLNTGIKNYRQDRIVTRQLPKYIYKKYGLFIMVIIIVLFVLLI